MSAFDSQFRLATEAIEAITAELSDPMMDFSEVGQIKGRLPYVSMIQMISEMAMQIETPGPEALWGIGDELRSEIHRHVMESTFSEDLTEILQALIDGVDLIREVA